jgi:hypothetical protein
MPLTASFHSSSVIGPLFPSFSTETPSRNVGNGNKRGKDSDLIALRAQIILF